MNEQVRYVEIEGIHDNPLMLEDLIGQEKGYTKCHILFKQHARAIVVHEIRTHNDQTMHITLVAQDYAHGIYAIAFTQAVQISCNIVAGGIGSSIAVRGIYCAGGEANVALKTAQLHAHPQGQSSVLFKGLLAGKASSLYTGTISIEKNALNSQADQSHYAMLLSAQAKSLSIPSLEILTDNVQCKHGSATGPIAQEELTYATSRGLSEKKARILLIQGFLADAFNESPQLQTFYGRWIDETMRDYYESS